ncbi:expressed unknown protein [Seminavis robusta]|uniref:Uncharacterized protein n=1 Tax=Seminavis robusta TaxID=568900 RepID=A0A9N8H921_9STRA|nr:expressed unknown protein [Seminavis robusta]|eukprot:Sro260_g101580.1 n/a (297) ;mRNA; f:40751-41641
MFPSVVLLWLLLARFSRASDANYTTTSMINATVIDLVVSTAYTEIDNLDLTTSRSTCEECQNRTGFPSRYDNTTTCTFRRGLLPVDACFRGLEGSFSTHYFVENQTSLDIFYADKDCQIMETDYATNEYNVGECSGVNNFDRDVLPGHCILSEQPEDDYLYPLVFAMIYQTQEDCTLDQGSVNPQWFSLEDNYCFETMRWSGRVGDDGNDDPTAIHGGYMAFCDANSSTLTIENFSDASCSSQAGIDPNWTSPTTGENSCSSEGVEGINPWRPWFRAPDCLAPSVFCKSLVNLLPS